MSGRVRHRITRVLTGKAYERKTTPEPAPNAPFDIDWDYVAELDNAVPGTRLSPTGACYDCDRAISGNRKFCGPCLTKRGRL